MFRFVPQLRRWTGSALYVSFALILACTASTGSRAEALSIVVNTLADTNDAIGSDTVSLRDAITEADDSGSSTITFQDNLTGTITLASALPAITAPTTITGPGYSTIIVDGAALYRPFIIQNSSGTVTISGLTIQHGSDKADSNGGANMYIGTPGTTPTQISNVVLNNDTFSGGVAGGNGGGAFFNNFSDVTVTNCTMNTNTANGTFPNGGAINNNFGTVSMTNCTLTGNTASAGGGAIFSQGTSSAATVSLTNCTFTGNTASTSGGAVWSDGSLCSTTILNCILYGDKSSNGLEVFTTGTGTASYSDFEYGLTGSGITSDGLNTSANPDLGALAGNGGPTQTIALAGYSPCIGAGSTSGAPPTDQRGYVRPSPPSMGAWDDGTIVATGLPPVISQLSPTSVIAGSGAFTLTLIGSGFIAISNVTFGSLALPATLNANGTLTVTVPSTAVTQIGPIAVTVANGSTAGGTSAPFTFNVDPLAPTISTITPNLAPEGSAAFPIVIQGTDFSSGAVVNLAGTQIPATIVSSLTIDATIPATLLTTVGTYQVTVTTSGPAGATSIPLFFNVFKPITTISGVSPAQVTAGQTGFTLAILGSNYMPGAVVTFNFAQVSATYVSSGEVDAIIPASAIATAGSYPVTITNPVLAGSASSSTFFTVTTAKTFPTGLAMISTPTSYAGTPIEDVLGYSDPVLDWWNPLTFSYDSIAAGDTTSFVPGRAFWVDFPQTTTLAALGTPTPAQPFATPLTAGWNMIGDPFVDEIPLSSLSVTLASGTTESFYTAVAAGLINSPLYEYATSPSRYILSGSLEPYVGYWISTSANCTLVIPNP